ncbi:hypothetical protein L4X63_09390 [Geomonas sp. Red32]|uniref:hypothetical protein n=1 Tax=Geomonas sp. Red32 TaxID=2912856 RepID=UPI00202CFCA8|nr:hypothetical protein [Geomonas sp. Red32]MCM0081802.1 hypothetical protein [Geomonas sp. Red32]
MDEHEQHLRSLATNASKPNYQMMVWSSAAWAVKEIENLRADNIALKKTIEGLQRGIYAGNIKALRRHEENKQLREKVDRLKSGADLVEFLREQQSAFAEDLDNGHDLIASFDGHFVAWDEIIDQCKQGLEDVGYSQSPDELISRLIDQRDLAEDRVKELEKELSRVRTHVTPAFCTHEAQNDR